MKKLFLIGILIVLGSFAFVSFNKKDQPKNNLLKGFVLIQLFTSQGCSSCPPADHLIDKVTQEYDFQNVYTLEYHVDYWDRLGWKDPFSKKEFTDKQYEYAKKFSSRSVYTPQAVINGKEHFTGSNEMKMTTAINKYLAESNNAEISISKVAYSDNSVDVSFSTKELPLNFKIYFALTIEERVTPIYRGENSGKALKNNSIVVNEKEWNIKEGKVNLEIPVWVNSKDKLNIIAYASNEKEEIIAATKSAVER